MLGGGLRLDCSMFCITMRVAMALVDRSFAAEGRELSHDGSRVAYLWQIFASIVRLL